jgi:hypothetical protein
LLFVSGCIDLSPVEKATKNIENASKNLKDGMTDLGHIDPIALNKLLKDNDELRATSQLLQDKIRAVDGVGSVYVGPNSEVYLSITAYTGTLRVNGWVDDERNKFMDNIVLEGGEKPFVLNKKWSDISRYDNTTWQQKDDFLAGTAQQSFDAYMTSPFTLPSPDSSLYSVDRRFLASGEHSIKLQLIPEVLDRNGEWIIEYRLYVKTDQKEYTVTRGRMDSKTSSFNLTKPLQAREVAFATVVVAPPPK